MSEEIISKNQKLGSALVSAAKEKYDKARQDAVIETVQCQLRLVDETKDAIARAQLALVHYEKTVSEIEAGNFVFTADGKIVMNEKSLTLGRYNPPGTFSYGS